MPTYLINTYMLIYIFYSEIKLLNSIEMRC